MWQNSRAQNVTSNKKLKVWQLHITKCKKVTQKFKLKKMWKQREKNTKYDKAQKLKMWQSLKTLNVTKL